MNYTKGNRLKIALTLLVVVLVVAVSAFGLYFALDSSEFMVGVEKGDWIKYEAELLEFDPHDPTVFNTERRRIKIEYVKVDGRNLVLNVTYSYLDGRSDISQMTGELGINNFEGFIVPANLNVGDSFSEGTEEFTIIGIENQTISNKSRKVVFGDITPMEGMKSYWDQKTGVLIKATMDDERTSYELTTTDTNLW